MTDKEINIALNEYANEDLEILNDQFELAITGTKYGVLWCKLKDGYYTASTQDGPNLNIRCETNSDIIFKTFLMESYTVDIK